MATGQMVGSMGYKFGTFDQGHGSLPGISYTAGFRALNRGEQDKSKGCQCVLDASPICQH